MSAAGESTSLLGWAQTQVSRLADEACSTIADRIRIYRDGEVISAGELREAIEDNLRFLIAAMANPEQRPDLATPRDTARRRAKQGVPLPEVLHAYRISFGTLWQALLEHGRHGSPAVVQELLGLSESSWQIADEHATVVTDTYRNTTAELLLSQQQRRSALVEALLTGHPGPDGGRWEAGALLGLPADADLLVVAADTRGLAEESLPLVERRLADHGIVSAWRLTPAQQLGVISARPDQLDTVLKVLREIATARTGVSPAYRSLGDTPRALHLAQAAIAGLPIEPPRVRMFSDDPLAALMVSEPAEAKRLVQQVLGPVLGLPADDRDVLLDTLTAYFGHGSSAERAAEVLYCHPNTVRYRLRRIQELTGRSLSDARGITDLVSASYALRLQPRADRQGQQQQDDAGAGKPGAAKSGPAKSRSGARTSGRGGASGQGLPEQRQQSSQAGTGP